ncbi:UV-endonuclease UvdE-domain-containing protein [Aspergillus bertholletiae]|uniref:UV-endonuclease UvdE-domain-containing protein n=1 Tax=Aspergillus bertholletiae TaxID=1226010 RepID=A0A5N7BCV6_9EURO|nr:UV-endonuclease UvdE-domain-containing protein [Aspergillus bertholletiae]
MFLRPFHPQQRTFGRALSCHHAARFHDVEEFGARSRRVRHSPAWWVARQAPVASPIPSLALLHTSCRSHYKPRIGSLLHSFPGRSLKLATTRVTTTLHSRYLAGSPRGIVGETQAAHMPVDVKLENGTSVNSPSEENTAQAQPWTSELPQDILSDVESDEDVPVQAEELQEALSRPPPVNSSYLPLPWKGRLGYACLNTYLRYSTPPVFCSRTCRIASILENRHPLLDPSQPPHPTKNRPDLSQTPDITRGQEFVEALGLANARDLVKILRWNDRYGIKFMRLSSEMFPFASHKEYGYRLAPFASEVLAEAGRVIAELGHRVSVHPGQFTQLGSPRNEVVENSIRDLEYHSEMLQLLQLPPQQDRDAVMILHMGGMFGDKEATLNRFRENYQPLSQDIKNRLVLENDDVSWSVHDLLPICEELDIPLVLDFHHHNIIFDSNQVREGTQDIMGLFDRIKATWARKGITQKMHYSEPTPSAITNSQRRKHSDRVSTLPPCDPTMDLMIEAKDKEQAVFELMRTFRLPGHELFNDMIPHVRTDENKPFKPPRKSTKKNGGFVDLEGHVPPARTVTEEVVGMGGPERRVYWPPTMEEWLRPKKVIRAKAVRSPQRPRQIKKADSGVEESLEQDNEGASASLTTPASTPPSKASQRIQRTSSIKKVSSRKRKASTPATTSLSASDNDALPETPKLTRSKSSGVRRSGRAKPVSYAEDSESL